MSIDAYGPSSKPISSPTIDEPVRCIECNRKLMELASRPWKARCPRCHCLMEAGPEGIIAVEHGSRR